ncbi:MAG TPA: hypothetical protein VJP02_05620 [Candidatus Sulfotelmatobacter sp.]|nr:hypothetical protein [Candidatus Sulfotelmatobacter sp.]
MSKAIDFQNQSTEEAKNFQQTVESRSAILGEEMTGAFQDVHNGWMALLNVWAQAPAGPAARQVKAELDKMYGALSEASRRTGFSPIASVFQDPATTEAAEDSTVLWRYLDRRKFRDLLTTCSLYFCRVDLFGEPFEGSIPANAVTQEIYPMPVDREFLNHFFFANCWHMNPHESVAMWKLYLRDEPGVAIQTIAGKLVSSLVRPRRGRVDVGCVEYLDYTADSFDYLGPINAYFRKRAEYQHEKEYRIVYHCFPPDYHSESSRQVLTAGPLRAGLKQLNVNIAMPAGVRIGVDLSFLERVVVSPSASNDFQEWIRAIIADTGFAPEIVLSALEQKPRF